MNIQKELFEMMDTDYKEFNAKLIPNIDPSTIIGVRTPALRTFAKKIKKDPIAAEFLNTLPHSYYEENNLHSFLISDEPSFKLCIEKLDKFLPYVDNWATCDGIKPKCFKSNTAALMPHIRRWLTSTHTYTIRFAIGMLMTHYLDDEFRSDFLHMVSEIRSDEYYVNMMIAWYFATALAKQYDSAIAYIEQNRLSVWTHNKTIQKAIESYRITDKQKDFLRSLKRKHTREEI